MSMTKSEVVKHWGGLQKRHRLEIGEAVAEYCKGNSLHKVAEWLGYTRTWVQKQLDYAGMAAALGGANAVAPLTGVSDNVAKEVPKLLSEYAPSEDDENFLDYRDHYEAEGHSPDVAKRLAKAELATEAAIDDGVIQESTNKRNEKVNKILFPEDSKASFEIDLDTHMARVKAAAKFLDNAKMSNLRKDSTCKKVASANEKWLEQVERVLDNHPTFEK